MLTINNTVEGYLKDVEIKGNTWQDSENLADIRSVGTKVEGQELYEIPVLSRGKNLFNKNDILFNTAINSSNGVANTSTDYHATNFIPIKPNTSYIRSLGTAIYYYDKDYKFISFLNHDINSPSNAKYCKLQLMNSWDLNTFQLEEGTQATTFEEYKEDKLTILSPTPLEKVGKVADRIICKNGVWGVEKNVNTINLIGGEEWSISELNDTLRCSYNPKLNLGNAEAISDIFEYNTNYSLDKEHFYVYNNVIWLFINKSRLDSTDKKGIESFLKSRNISIKYQVTQPQFIPLPHDQQVKLRTFANRTNIHFETEIEPTLKAQVPKSLGATVNTHTTQIDNLNKELDRVKKLEESTVSTITSDKAFTTIAETNGGYFENVKIEGKTLVNLFRFKDYLIVNGVNLYAVCSDTKDNNMTSNRTFTFRNTTSRPLTLDISENNAWKRSVILHANKQVIVTTTPTEYVSYIYGTGSSGWDVNSELHKQELKNACILLESDHTDKDISYFEGLKSVGQDVDEISVSSVNGGVDNANNKFIEIHIDTGVEESNLYCLCTGFNYISTDENVFLYRNGEKLRNGVTKRYYTKDKKYIGATITSDSFYVRYRFSGGSSAYEGNISEYEVKNSIECIEQDKKQILYYNPNTQTWEKPVLREWDSIEKHSNGKYYYHKRCEEVVLNGSENWSIILSLTKDNTLFYHLSSDDGKNSIEAMCDKFEYYSQTDVVDYECFRYHTGFQIRINKTKLSTQDVAGFKAWLQANPTTVVYQLAEEEVYECTNLDLITYPNETNLIVSSGAIQPKITLKVLSNISNVVRLLQEKVSVLENNTSSYIVTQNRLQLASTYAADSVTFKVDYASAFDNRSVDGYNPDLYNLILSNILVGKDNYDYYKMFSIILDYASWDQISWEQFDELVLLMDIQHNPPIEIPEEDYTEEEIPEI